MIHVNCVPKKIHVSKDLVRGPPIVSLDCRTGRKHTIVAQALQRPKGSRWGGGGVGSGWSVPLPLLSFVQIFALLTAQDCKQSRY